MSSSSQRNAKNHSPKTDLSPEEQAVVDLLPSVGSKRLRVAFGRALGIRKSRICSVVGIDRTTLWRWEQNHDTDYLRWLDDAEKEVLREAKNECLMNLRLASRDKDVRNRISASSRVLSHFEAMQDRKLTIRGDKNAPLEISIRDLVLGAKHEPDPEPEIEDDAYPTLDE